MISPAYITEWSEQCPWIPPAQVVQESTLPRGVVETQKINLVLTQKMGTICGK